VTTFNQDLTNTKFKTHEMFRNIFVFSFFRDFVMKKMNIDHPASNIEP